MIDGPETTPPARLDDRVRGITDLRRYVARGMLTNGAFEVGLIVLTALRGLAVATFVSRSDYGIWGLIGLTMWTALALKSQAGAGERYVQQSELDQQLAFQRAWTVEWIFTAVCIPISVAVIVAVAATTGNAAVIAPAIALLTLLPAAALQFPLAAFYRRMDFRRQRTLQAVDPVVGAVVMIGLAAAGAGYWSFVIGTLAGAWSLAAITLRSSPYPLAWRYEPGALRSYVSFSAPLLITAVAVLAVFYVVYLVGENAIGIAALGAYTLVGNLLQFTDQADNVITGTLYPAVCAVQDRVGLLSEIFVKSNRLSLIWAAPFGIALALFAHDLVRYVLGSQWLPAVPLLEIMGLVTAVHHVGYNWGAFAKARGTTWPIAVSAVLVSLSVIAASVPLMYDDGLTGLGLAFAIGEAVAFVVRGVWVSRLFTGVTILGQLVRGFAPAVLAAVPVLIGRWLFGAGEGPATAIAAVLLYVVITIVSTIALERRLLREALGALLKRGLAPT